MRDAWKRLHDLCLSTVEDDNDSMGLSWFQMLDGTNWFYLLSRILTGARRIAEILADEVEPAPVLIHCSDGWDRTSQLSSLAQLLLDPYFRTFEGFQILICKEWLSYGHQFALRGGHNYGGREDPEQESPIFLQFLDCVYQLTVQFPTSFEFSETMLSFLHEAMCQCRFGTFLMNCEREREEGQLPLRTRSVWEYLSEHREDYVNVFYQPTVTEGVCFLCPRTNIPNLTLWREYYFKYLESSPTPYTLLTQAARKLKQSNTPDSRHNSKLVRSF